MIVSTIKDKDDLLQSCYAIFRIFILTSMNLDPASGLQMLASLSLLPLPTPFCFLQKHKEFLHPHIKLGYD